MNSINVRIVPTVTAAMRLHQSSGFCCCARVLCPRGCRGRAD